LQVKAIEPLLRLFEDENIKKVFHSCTSDLLLLDELYDCRSKNIEDTALMYKVAFDYGQDIGLKNLLAQTLGIEIEKEEQTSNWLERPLRNAQIFYAAKDVRYLFEMRKVLLTKMSDKQLRSYEAQRLKFNRLRYRKNHDWQNVFVKKHKLNRRNTFVAYKLLQLREEIAKRCDRPRFMVLSDDRLVQLLENLPQDLMQWKAFVSTHRLISENSTPEEFFESTKRFLLPESEWGILPEEFVMLIRKSQRPHNALLIAERDEYVRFLKEYSDQKKSEGEAVFSLAPPKMREIVIFGIYEVYKENQAKQIEEILEKEGRDPFMLSFSLYDGTYSEE
jgi:ribonuclease D